MATSSPTFVTGTRHAGSITYQHPEYQNRWWWWEFNRVSYIGGREYYAPNRIGIDFQMPVMETKNTNGQSTVQASTITRFWYNSLLHRHQREETWEYENRRTRAYYYNFPKLVVDSLVSHATKRPPTRRAKLEAPEPEEPPEFNEGETPEVEPTDEPDSKPAFPPKALTKAVAPKSEPKEPLEEFWDAIDERRRTRVDQFMQDGLRWATVAGIYWCCVDVRDDAEGGDGKPYAYWVSPLDIWDWSVDDEGEIAWLKQFVFTETAREWNQPVKPVYRFRIWYPDRVEEWESEGDNGATGKLLSTKPNPLGRVPFEPLYSRRCIDTLFPDGNSLAADLFKVSNRVFNLCSQLGEILDNQTFSQLVVPDPGGRLDKIQVGIHRFFGYDAQGGSGAPEYVSPDADQARVMMEAIGACLEIAKSMVGVGRGRSESSKQQASADALELESDDKRAILATIADEAEDFERRLAKLFLAYANETPAEGEADEFYIQYQRNFDLRSFQAKVSETLEMAKVPLPPKAAAEDLKALIRDRFDGMPPPDLDALLAEVDSIVVEREAKKQAEHEARVEGLASGQLTGAPNKATPPFNRPGESRNGDPSP